MNTTFLRYNALSRILHWGIAFLVLGAIALIEIKDFFPEGMWRNDVMSLHIQAGLLVFGLIWLRLFWRITHPAPAIVPPLDNAQHLAAQLVHGALYALMVIIPLLGFLALQSKGKVLSLAGFEIPALLDEDIWLPYAEALKDNHELLGNILIGLIGLHVLSALWHHIFRHDNTLKRILP